MIGISQVESPKELLEDKLIQDIEQIIIMYR